MHAGSFRTRLLTLVLLLIIPTILLAFVGNFQRQRSEKDRARERATYMAKLAAASEAYYVRQTRQLLSTMTQFPFLVQLPDKKASELGLKNLKLISPDYDDFGLIETNGTVFCHLMETNVIETISKALIEKSLKTRGFVADVFVRDQHGDAPTLQFAYPVRNTNREVVRVMYASLKTELLSDALKDISLPEGGMVNVFDEKGTFLVSHPKFVNRGSKKELVEGIVQKSLQQKEGIFEAMGLNGERQLFAVSMVRHRNSPVLFVTVGIPRREIFSTADQQLIASCFFILLLVAVLLALAWWYSDRMFLRPLSAMATAAERIIEGDLGARSGLANGTSELHVFAQRFDKMAESLQRRQSELEAAHFQISLHNTDLERKVAERTSELEHLNKELEAFSYSVSHDLRAPLRHMNGFAQMLGQNPLFQSEPQVKRQLGLIVSSANQMGVLVDDLLSFSRMGRQPLHLRTVNLDSMVKEVVADLQSQENGRAIEWLISSLPEVQADPPLMRQVWVNLISNALKYTRGKPSAVVFVSCQRSDNELIFSVRDNGAGFDMAYADKLFGVFQRLHSAEEFEGTGIGLANVRRIIDRHGGRTWAEGKIDEGATIWFSLRVCESKA
jgi:signal transduction histidine kinase